MSTETVVKIEPTSAKLQELKTAQKEIQMRLIQQEPGSAEFDNVQDELLLNRNAQKAEKIAIVKLEADNAAALVKAERVGLIDTFEAAVLAAAAKGAGDAEKQAKQAAKDVLVNAVLPNSAKAASMSAGTGAAKGSVSSAIKALFIEHVAGGKTPAEAAKLLQEAPYNYARGTVGTVKTELYPVK